MTQPDSPRTPARDGADRPARLLEELAPPRSPEADPDWEQPLALLPSAADLGARVGTGTAAVVRRRRRELVAAAALAGVVALSWVVAGTDLTTTPRGPAVGWTDHGTGPQPQRQGRTFSQVSALADGACGVYDPLAAETGVGAVPCEEPHDFRVVGRVPVASPGDGDVTQTRTNKACADAFPQEAGAASDDAGIRAALPTRLVQATEPAICVVRT